jgi:hypothetical protein
MLGRGGVLVLRITVDAVVSMSIFQNVKKIKFDSEIENIEKKK